MPAEPTVDQALQRLDLALRALELAVTRRLEADRSIAGLEDEVNRLGDDRSRLADDLDRQTARANRLEDVNREVSRRLVSAMESIRSVLDQHGG